MLKIWLGCLCLAISHLYSCLDLENPQDAEKIKLVRLKIFKLSQTMEHEARVESMFNFLQERNFLKKYEPAEIAQLIYDAACHENVGMSNLQIHKTPQDIEDFKITSIFLCLSGNSERIEVLTSYLLKHYPIVSINSLKKMPKCLEIQWGYVSLNAISPPFHTAMVPEEKA